jgi:NTP pyrophosphatase (non-canonical NTP hydrolase)
MYSFEKMPDGSYRIRDAQDNRVATCHDRVNAMVVSMALNGMTFAQLERVNLRRAMRWHKGGLAEWNIAEWTNAMAGEAGEACNASKKLRRIECSMQQADGDSPAPKTIKEAEDKILKEIGDTVIYADLVCQRIGRSMADAVRMAFNQVSEREGFPERL